jgi:hypothetical protein
METVLPTSRIVNITPELGFSDYLGTVKVRLDIVRMAYTVQPGIYAINQPDANSPVMVSANYKLSFDHLRSNLARISAWILVLDSKGVNVWCAAGKGTFGTDELVNRIEECGLANIVQHRKLIVPQLGAVGISAHEVRKRSGFSVVYGPVRAADIKSFLENDCTATEEMRQVRFGLPDRLVLTPVEVIMNFKHLLIAAIGFLVLAGLTSKEFTFADISKTGFNSALLLATAYLAGTVAGPALLPFLPGRSFSFKGAVLGFIVALALWFAGSIGNWPQTLAWLLIILPICSYLLMNFTGCSTYTSQAGVKKEMCIAVPLQIISAVAGIVLWVIIRFI